MIAAAACLWLAALTTAHVRKELKALKRVPKFKYLDCERSTLQSAELLRRPGKNAKKVEKTKKEQVIGTERGEQRGRERVRLPFAVFTDEQCLCVKHMLTHSHMLDKRHDLRDQQGGVWRACVTCMCIQLASRSVPLRAQMPAGFDSFGLISLWFTPGMQTESSLSAQRKSNSASVAEKWIFVFSGLQMFAVEPRGDERMEAHVFQKRCIFFFLAQRRQWDVVSVAQEVCSVNMR